MRKKIVCAVSGGRSSAYCAYLVQNSPKYADCDKYYVFCNTGQERPETIKFLSDMVYYWGIPLIMLEGVYSTVKGVGVGFKIVDFDSLNMSSEPLRGALLQKNKLTNVGMFNSGLPFCSDYTKKRVTDAWARSVLGSTDYIKCVGFRKEDMPKRITFAEITADNSRIFPLITDFDRPQGLQDLTAFFASQPFQLGLHYNYTNCTMCWQKTEKQLAEQIKWDRDRNSGNHLSFMLEMMDLYSSSPYYNMYDLDTIIAMSLDPTRQMSLFDDDESTGYNCVCSF